MSDGNDGPARPVSWGEVRGMVRWIALLMIGVGLLTVSELPTTGVLGALVMYVAGIFRPRRSVMERSL